MTGLPERIFLDTNVYIIGAAIVDSAEAEILDWVGFDGTENAAVEVVVSAALFDQIRRVARRLQGKDWAGEILMRIWQYLNVRYVIVDPQEIARTLRSRAIPREDAEIFLAARTGQVDYFVSANRELVRAAAAQTAAFTCLAPQEFVGRYLSRLQSQ